jgi:phospho-N-acetylmuramoyl-pentapeptide-transferase
MAPLHHHFEMSNWSETQITQRFVLITIIASLLGISLTLSLNPSTETARQRTADPVEAVDERDP